MWGLAGSPEHVSIFSQSHKLTFYAEQKGENLHAKITSLQYPPVPGPDGRVCLDRQRERKKVPPQPSRQSRVQTARRQGHHRRLLEPAGQRPQNFWRLSSLRT